MSANSSILMVGANARNLELLAAFLAQQGYRTLSAHDLAELDQAIEHASDIALALVDVSGFDAAIWPRCQQIHERNIRLLIISPRQSMAIQKESLTHGARGVLVKPLVMRELTGLIRSLMEA